ncbi:transcription factor TFIIIB subunit brf1 [Gnomoniopsis sp. IMI 355080]|nr:transcription factor TFIIIB subunit brf1 [Gnomoniopsis sp. IMI 355080]
MSSMIKASKKAGNGKPRHNPIRALHDREWKRKQKERSASIASSAARSPTPQPAPGGRPQRKCKQCNDPKINSEGICENCGAVCEEDANIVSEVTFGETSGGAAYVTGVSVAHGEAGPRMDMQNGKRRVAGNGGGKTRHQTLQMAALSIQSICFKLRGAVPASVQDTANYQFGKVQCVGWVRGRGIERVAAACLYYAIRKSDFTGVMLIDIADAINADVFVLGGTFKALLNEIHGVDDGTGHKVIRNCPFEPLYPEDIIKNYAARLKFDLKTEQVQMDAVRILQRMDRDWIVSGRKPAGICGAALVLAARMNNFRRTPTEVAYLAKIGKVTVDQRIGEFRLVGSAQMTVADFRDKAFIKDAHDPPAFYRQTKEYQEEQQKKKAEKAERIAARKRQRRSGDGESDDEGEAETANATKKQRTDADGFVIPPLPNNARSPPRSTHPGGEEVTAADVSEAVPLDDEDQELALASKYGDVPVPNAKEIRKNRMQGSSLRKPNCDEDEQLTPEEEEAMETIMQQINDTESQVYVAASQVAGVQRQALMAALASSRPINYREDGQIDAPDVHEDEFADDPEVMNCLLTESERLIKEKLWLNENKQWLREQQEKEYKARTAPPKKNRRKNPRKPRLGEGQTSPASSAAEATVKLTKRVGLSRKFNYDAAAIAAKLFSSGRRGPGSVMGSEATSAQTSRAGSMVDESDDEAAEESGNEGVVEDDDDDDGDVVEDYDEQVHNEDDGEEFGGGYDDDY